MNWLKMAFHRWNDFGGRSDRREFSAYLLFFVPFAVIFVWLTGISTDRPGYVPELYEALAMLALVALFFALLVPAWAVTIRRLHDVNLPRALILFVGVLFLPLAFLSGTKGENNYGDEPGEPSDYLGKY